MSNIPREDLLRRRSRAALPSRSVRAQKLVEGEIDAGLLQGKTANLTDLAEGQAVGLVDGKLAPLDLVEADATAIHRGAAGEIATIPEKVTPAAADLLVIEDSAAANVKKRVQVGNLPGGGGGGSVATDVIWDADGDLAVGSGPDTAARLARGAASSVLQPCGTTLAWTTTPTIAGLLTLNAGLKLAAAQQVQDSGGTGRILLATATPHLTLTGDLRVSGGFVGINTAPDPVRRLKVLESGAPTAAQAIAEFTTSGLTLNTGIGLTALIGVPLVTVAAAAAAGDLIALNFSFGATGGTGGGTMSVARGIDIRTFFPNWNGALAELTGIYLANQAISGAGSVALATGIYIPNWGDDGQVVDYYGLRIGNPTLNTGFRRLIEAGPATPNLRLEGNAPSNPGAGLGRSQLLLAFNENGTVTLRRVEHKSGTALVAGDKVLVAI